LPARLLALVGFASPPEVCAADRVARSLAPRAPPSPCDGLGVFLDRPDSRDRLRSRKILSWSSFPLQSRTTSRLSVPRSRRRPACAGRDGRQARKSPLLGFFLPRALSTSGAPFAAGRVGLPRRVVRRVEVARPPPVPSSGFLPLSTVLAALAARAGSCRSPSSAVTPRRFAALFRAARAPGVALQSFPFPRSRTRSRGPRASLRVRVRLPTGATAPSGSRLLSPARRPLARAHPAVPCGMTG